MNESTDITPEESVNEISYDQDSLSVSNNESNSNLFSNNDPLANNVHRTNQFRTQREIDESIPSPVPVSNSIEIPIETETDNQINTEKFIEKSQTNLIENLNENESTMDQRIISSSESNSPNSSSEYEITNEVRLFSEIDFDQSSPDQTGNSSNEVQTDSNDNNISNLNESNDSPIVTDENSSLNPPADDHSDKEKTWSPKPELDLDEKPIILNEHQDSINIDLQSEDLHESNKILIDKTNIISNENLSDDDVSSNPLIIDQTENSLTEFVSNPCSHVDEIKIESSEFESSLTESDKSTENKEQIEIKCEQTNQFENNTIVQDLSNNNLLTESNANEINDPAEEFQPDSTENVCLDQSKKVNEDINLEKSSIDEMKNDPIDEMKNDSIELKPTLTENNIDFNEKTFNEKTNDSSIESEKENQDPNRTNDLNNTLKSYSLPDVINEKSEENLKNSVSNNNQFEEVLNEQVPSNNEDQLSLLDNKSDLSNFEDILGNKTLLKKINVQGEPNSRPTRSTMATVSYKLSLIDSLTSNVQFIENISNERFFVSEYDIIGAVDICVQTMNRGESALINCDSRHCYGDLGCVEKNIPPISSNNSYRMLIELELHDWTSPSDIRKLSINERLYWGDKKRQMGNFHYRRQDYQTSLQCYNGALRFLDIDMNPILITYDENQRLILSDGFIQVENNVAQVNLLLKKYDACLAAVEKVLQHDPKNVKALFRQGKAFFQLGSYDKAIQPLKLFMQIQKGDSNSAVDMEKANEMIQTCENKLAKYQKNEKEIYQRMFRPISATNSTSNQKYGSKNINQIDQKTTSWWPYIALSSAVVATVALVTLIKYRKIS